MYIIEIIHFDTFSEGYSTTIECTSHAQAFETAQEIQASLELIALDTIKVYEIRGFGLRRRWYLLQTLEGRKSEVRS